MKNLRRFERIIERLICWFGSSSNIILFILPGVAALFLNIHYHQHVDRDLFVRISMGRLIALTGKIPLQDVFAFTPTHANWYDHEWLSGVVFYQVVQLGRDLGLYLFALLTVLGTAFVLHKAQRHLVREYDIAAVWLFLCLAPMAYFWQSVIRSRVFTMFFLSFFLLAFIRYRTKRDRRLLWMLPIATTIWCNFHGGFLIGIGCVGIFALSLIIQRQKDAWVGVVCLVGCIAATLVNPYGLDYWGFIISAVSKARPLIHEWSPMSLGMFGGLFLFIIIIVVKGILRREPGVPLEGKLILLISLYYGMNHYRFIALFGAVAAVYGSVYFVSFIRAFCKTFPTHYQAWRRIIALLMAGCVIASMFYLGTTLIGKQGFSLNTASNPIHAMEWLVKNREGGKLLVYFNEGNYALWRGYPRFKVSLDGRYETVYPDSTVEMIRIAYHPPHPQHAETVKQIDPDYILACEATAPEVGDASFGSDWYLVYKDALCRIFSREESPDGVIAAAPAEMPDIWTPLLPWEV